MGEGEYSSQYIWSLVLILTVWWYQGTWLLGQQIPAMMTESVRAGPNFNVISCLCLWTARWSSFVNLWNETETKMWKKKKKWLSALSKMSYQTSYSKVDPWEEGLEREWEGRKKWKWWKRRGDGLKKRKQERRKWSTRNLEERGRGRP